MSIVAIPRVDSEVSGFDAEAKLTVEYSPELPLMYTSFPLAIVEPVSFLTNAQNSYGTCATGPSQEFKSNETSEVFQLTVHWVLGTAVGVVSNVSEFTGDKSPHANTQGSPCGPWGPCAQSAPLKTVALTLLSLSESSLSTRTTSSAGTIVALVGTSLNFLFAIKGS